MDHFRAQCFVSVARHLSISKAAEELFVTQPAMTAQIKKLEGELGSDLFIRDGGRMILTPAGKEILGLLEEYLEVAEEVDRKLDVLRSNAKKKLAIGFHGPYGLGWDSPTCRSVCRRSRRCRVRDGRRNLGCAA